MLDTLRKNSKSALIYVFFGIIIIVFVFSFGPGSSGCQPGSFSGSQVAATVNGRDIPASDFQQTYSRIYNEYQSRAGGAFSEELAASIRLKETVLDQMIDRELLAQAAAAHGIELSGRELADEIEQFPAFQVDGRFNHEQYRMIVERQLGLTPAQFEDDLRRDLLAQKMLGSLAESAKVSDDEVRAEFIREREKIDLGFVRFSPQSFKAEVAAPTDAQIDELLKSEAARVEASFKDNAFRYNKPKRVRARHILAKVDEQAPETEVEAARKKIEEVQGKLAEGADFAALAGEYSDDPGSKEKGGDLGVFGPGTMTPAFQDAAFALDAGKTSGVVRTPFGFHLIKVEEVLPEEKKELKDVEREIAAELLVDDAAKELARKKAEEALAQARDGKSLEAQYPAAEKKEEAGVLRFGAGSGAPQADATGPFSPSGEYIPRIGVDETLSREVLALTEQQPVAAKPYEINGSFYAVVLKSHERADLAELDSKMDEYRDKARQRKAGELVDAFVKSLKEQAKIEKNESLLGPGGGALGAYFGG